MNKTPDQASAVPTTSSSRRTKPAWNWASAKPATTRCGTTGCKARSSCWSRGARAGAVKSRRGKSCNSGSGDWKARTSS